MLHVKKVETEEYKNRRLLNVKLTDSLLLELDQLVVYARGCINRKECRNSIVSEILTREIKRLLPVYKKKCADKGLNV